MNGFDVAIYRKRATNYFSLIEMPGADDTIYTILRRRDSIQKPARGAS